MNPQTLFISDLHLDPTQPKITKLFLDFLTTQAPKADALYILGDLFEVWIGDDDVNKFTAKIKDALKKLALNIPVYFMPGNRDFLIGQTFAEQTGCRLLQDPNKVNLYGVPTLLMHGDSLCTTDIRHQQFRRFSQNALVKIAFLATPLMLRKKLANKIRNASKKRTGNMPAAIMDVTPAAVKKIMKQSQVLQLIHGHTHQPDIHLFSLHGKSVKRIVLGAWHKEGSVLICQPNSEPELIKFK